MFKEGVKKTPGRSLIELGNRAFEFVMGDRSHPRTTNTYAMLREITKLLKLEGYVPHTANVLADIEDEEKDTALSYHCEKLQSHSCSLVHHLGWAGPGLRPIITD
ncbi:hypothetical protein Vadar_022517 [Vaccinium darrowii]|uniref:Uncharacterized protein n=1 Tax=Vaccinium darrowii TaxID=229202 RepID=A0ACB7XC49_9ERIC|nr:hypothetical protein Vadar_022517 [Vaccinium darrowii]